MGAKRRELEASAPACAARGRRGQWVLWPRVLRIPATHFLANFPVTGLPEAGQILGNLHRSPRRREELEGDRHSSSANARSLGQSEHLLQAHGNRGASL